MQKSEKTLCKHDIWNPSTSTYENDKNLESIIGDSVVIWDEITEVTKTVPTKPIPTKIILTKNIATETFSANLDEKR